MVLGDSRVFIMGEGRYKYGMEGGEEEPCITGFEWSIRMNS